jgi:lipopolysaccharide export system permease protein
MQDKARSFIRTSDLDFFESLLKPKKFIDIIENLTIYFEERDESGKFKNIFLNDKSNQSSQITFAKKGKIEIRNNKKVLVLEDGETIKDVNGRISKFEFSKTDFNISKFTTKTTITKKIQETSTKDLIKCLIIFHKSSDKIKISKIILDRNCGADNLENIHQELYSRLIKPMYITFLMTISLLLILRSKNDHLFNSIKIKVYLLGFLSIVFLELSSKLINTNLIHNLFFIILPISFILTIYVYFLKFLKTN